MATLIIIITHHQVFISFKLTLLLRGRPGTKSLFAESTAIRIGFNLARSPNCTTRASPCPWPPFTTADYEVSLEPLGSEVTTPLRSGTRTTLTRASAPYYFRQHPSTERSAF